jgi:hypothetical protein
MGTIARRRRCCAARGQPLVNASLRAREFPPRRNFCVPTNFPLLLALQFEQFDIGLGIVIYCSCLANSHRLDFLYQICLDKKMIFISHPGYVEQIFFSQLPTDPYWIWIGCSFYNFLNELPNNFSWSVRRLSEGKHGKCG